MENLARLDDAGVHDAIKDVEAAPAGHDKAVMAHEGQMLGEVGLWQGGDFKELLDRRLALLQYIEDFQAFGVGKYLVYESVLLVGLFWER